MEPPRDPGRFTTLRGGSIGTIAPVDLSGVVARGRRLTSRCAYPAASAWQLWFDGVMGAYVRMLIGPPRGRNRSFRVALIVVIWLAVAMTAAVADADGVEHRSASGK